ncbi:ATP-binding protein [Christensenellaceae bacterium OttesenSCG-928-K19]|nr:ATP-binding protein [Christensenellaceae bacterium OttesenSCG-928-K19]
MPKWIKRNSKPLCTFPRSTQRTIPIKKLWPGGVYEHNGEFTMSGRFEDINYQAASVDDKERMLGAYEEIIKANDIDKRFKVTLLNRLVNEKSISEDISLADAGDGYDDLRGELNDVNYARATEGNNNIVREKYFTIATKAKRYDDTKSWFNRVESTLMTNFSVLGSGFARLSGEERLRVLHDFFRPDEQEHFNVDLDAERLKGHSIIDSIAPDGMKFEETYFRIGRKYGRALKLATYPATLQDTMITELMSLPKQMALSIDMISEDKAVSLDTVGKKYTEVASQIKNASRKDLASGDVSMTISPLLMEQKTGFEEIRDLLMNYDQRIEWVQINMVHMADSLEELNNDTDTLRSIWQSYMCKFVVCEFEQEQALNTALPYGLSYTDEWRTLTSANCATLMPFMTKEIWDKKGVIYGLNTISKNLVMADRRSLLNGNAFVLGVPGSGKSFISKYELANVFLSTDDDIIILDPEAEFFSLVHLLGGAVIRLASGSDTFINAMDVLKHGRSDDDDPVRIKCDFILTLVEKALGSLTGQQRTFVDRCTRELLTDSAKTGKVVTLLDLYNKLKAMRNKEAKEVATCLELYVLGSLNNFAQPTNVDLNNRLICFDIRDLGEQSKGLAMLITLDAIQNRVAENRKRGRRTWIYIDEIWMMYREEYTANFFDQFWRRIRKYGALGVGITQNVSSMLESAHGRDMLSNSEFLLMFNQAASDRGELAKLLNISDAQRKYIENAPAGCGLMRRSSVIIPFDSTFDRNTRLYQAITTKIEEVAHG